MLAFGTIKAGKENNPLANCLRAIAPGYRFDLQSIFPLKSQLDLYVRAKAGAVPAMAADAIDPTGDVACHSKICPPAVN